MNSPLRFGQGVVLGLVPLLAIYLWAASMVPVGNPPSVAEFLLWPLVVVTLLAGIAAGGFAFGCRSVSYDRSKTYTLVLGAMSSILAFLLFSAFGLIAGSVLAQIGWLIGIFFVVGMSAAHMGAR